jgi:hypothetical protein
METLKSAGGVLLGIAVFAAFLCLIALFFYGVTYVSAIILPYLNIAMTIALALCLFVFLPGAFFSSARPLSMWGFLYSSYIFGAVAWLYSVIVAYVFWGIVPMIVGICFMGVGVVPVALLAALFHGAWWQIANIIFPAALYFGARMGAFWVAHKRDAELMYRA